MEKRPTDRLEKTINKSSQNSQSLEIEEEGGDERQNKISGVW